MEQSTSEAIKSDGNCKDVRQLLSLQNQKPLVFLGVPSLMFPGVSLVLPGVGSNFPGVPSCSKENVLGKDHLSQRN